MNEWIAIALIVFSAFIVISYCLKRRFGSFKFVLNSIVGTAVLFISSAIGFNVQLNIFCVLVSVLLGVPGVIGVLISQVL